VHHRGNNVNSIGPDGYTRRPKSNGDYTYYYDSRKEPNVGENTDASVVNAFYVGNTVHDIAYRYGFTETAFNYQNNNFEKGGKESDPVMVYVQDKSGMNNAYFTSVPELVFESFISSTPLNRASAVSQESPGSFYSTCSLVLVCSPQFKSSLLITTALFSPNAILHWTIRWLSTRWCMVYPTAWSVAGLRDVSNRWRPEAWVKAGQTLSPSE